MKVEQTKSTRNQSTAQFTEGCVFMGNNRYEEGTISVAVDTTVQNGMLLIRDVAKPNGFKLAESSSLSSFVGVLKVGLFPVELKTGSDLNIAVCVKGDLDANALVMPSTVTLDTVVDDKFLRDVIEGSGLHLIATTEQTKF